MKLSGKFFSWHFKHHDHVYKSEYQKFRLSVQIGKHNFGIGIKR